MRVKLTKNDLKELIKHSIVDIMSEADADKAHKMGLKSKGFGNWVDPKTGQHYSSRGGKLHKVDTKDKSKGASEPDDDDAEIDKIAQIRKAGGAGYFCRVEDHINIGGNDPIFEPMYWEDKDLFMRMQMEGYKFIMTSKSLIWHFTSRTSRFPNGQKELDNNKRPAHLVRWEQRAMQRFIEKWGRLPNEDEDSFVVPIEGTNNPNKIEWPF